MKKIFLTIIILAIANIFTTSVKAFQIGDLYYSPNADGKTCSVVGYIFISHAYHNYKSLTIPEIASDGEKEYLVTTIKSNVFYQSDLDKIHLPESIRTIGDSAFEGSGFLTEINIPEGIEVLPKACFRSTGIPHITLPSTLKRIESDCFYGSNLLSVYIPANVEYIGEGAFGNNHMWSVVFDPECKITIENYAFSPYKNYSHPYWVAESNITSITFPENLKSIGYNAFENIPLKDVYYYTLYPVPISTNAFESTTYSKANLHVPPEALMFESTAGWSKFKNIKYDFTDPNVSEITDIKNENDSDEMEIFNIQGIKIASTIENLAPGNYIIRTNGSTKKVLIK